MSNITVGEINEYTKKYSKTLVPNVLPNNIKIWRELMQNMSVKQLADDLMIDRNFLTAVEAQDKNFSGKTTVRYIKYFSDKIGHKINFYTMYDVQKKCTCDTTDEKFYSSDCTLVISIDEVLVLYEQEKKTKKENPSIDDLIEYITTRNPVIEKHLRKKIVELTKYFKKNSNFISVKFDEYEVKNTKVKDGKIVVDFIAIFKKEYELKNYEFDINFARDEEKELTRMMINMGYKDEIATLEYEVDDDYISVVNGKVILNKEYKIPNGKEVDDYYTTDTLDIKKRDGNVEVKKAEDGTPTSVKFKSVRPAINNFKKFRVLTGSSIAEMSAAVGLTYNGYINLELGNQKISSKIMWRICKNLRVPIEKIVNIDEYAERYCRHIKIQKKNANNR